VNTKDILNRGMLTAIEVVGGRFREAWCLFPMWCCPRAPWSQGNCTFLQL